MGGANVEETKTQTAQEKTHASGGSLPLVHRVCEGCNNMFTAPADSPERRCPNCRKGHE